MSEEEAAFHAAADYVASAVSSGSASFSDKSKLSFYGLYKQATSGECTTSKPAFWDMAGRAKWDAWKQLGKLSQEDAMVRYVDMLTDLVPDWDSASAQGSKQRSGMGPVFSSLAAAESSGEDDEGEGFATLHELAGQNDTEGVQALLAGGVNVDSRDEEGCTPLHFAADRGHVGMAQLLVGAGADVNAQDEDGQTPLHYAALCGNEQVAKLLLDCGCDVAITNSQQQTARAIANPDWSIWS